MPLRDIKFEISKTLCPRFNGTPEEFDNAPHAAWIPNVTYKSDSAGEELTVRYQCSLSGMGNCADCLES